MSINRYLISEFCGHDIYMGWHLYLRDSKKKRQRNADGSWGWILWSGWRDGRHGILHPAQAVFDALEITMLPDSDGTLDSDGYAELARRFPIPRQRIWGKPRGCVAVVVDEWGRIELANHEQGTHA